jgi:hypothetical protein
MRLTPTEFNVTQGTFSLTVDAAKVQVVAGIGASAKFEGSTFTYDVGNFTCTHTNTGYTWNTSAAAVNATLGASGHTWNTAANNYVNLSTTAYDARVGAARLQLNGLNSVLTFVGATRTQSLTLANDSVNLINGANAYFSLAAGNGATMRGGLTRIDCTDSGIAMYVASTAFYIDSLPSGTGTNLVISAGNAVTKLTSSLRYKKDVSDLEIDSSKIYQLVNKSFTYKDSNERTFGLIAEEVDEILPEIVFYDKDGNPDCLNYNGIPLLLIEELKKLKTKIEELEIEIQSLKGITNE